MERTTARLLPVLTYHSISAAPGPTSIPADVFRMQMDVLAERGFRSVTCEEFVGWHERRPVAPVPPRSVLLTFDDAFADFAEAAHPILRAHDYRAIVFVPTGRAGGAEQWDGANASARRLLDWSTIRMLAAAGIEFGGHGVSHSDLTRLAPDARRREIDGSARDLADHLGRMPRSFAAPYGRVNAAVLADIARTYEVAFGTRFARAAPGGERYDVPRIEMHYFREARHWRAFVDGAFGYFLARRMLRAARNVARRLLAPGATG